MPVVLGYQLDAFERTADDFAARSGGSGDMAALRQEVEATIAVLLASFEAFGKVVRRYQEEIPDMMTSQVSADLHGYFVRLAAVFDRIMPYGAAVERAGFEVAGKAEFKRVWRELKGIAAVTPAELQASFNDLSNGGGKTLAEFEDELSRRLGN
jgi:hypothetical protein